MAVEMVLEPGTGEKRKKAYWGGSCFPVDTLENHLGALIMNLPEGIDYFRNQFSCNGTKDPETAYMVFDKRAEHLTWDERRLIGLAIATAERRRNLVTEWNPEKQEFEPGTPIASSLYEGPDDPAALDYLIIGVVGPNARKYGIELYHVISEVLIPSIR